MSDAAANRTPKTQAAASGGPPKPPKKTSMGLGDDSPDPGKLSDAERAELADWFKKEARKGK